MTEQTIDLLPFLEGHDDSGVGDLGVREGDLLNLVAETGELWLPAIFAPDSFEHLEEWVGEVRAKLRAAGVHTAIISADVFDRDDNHRQLEVELQVTFVGALPVQLDAMGDFYGYDDEGNLLSREQYEDALARQDPALASAAGVVWGVVAGLVVVALTVAYSVKVASVTVTSPEAREPIHELSEATKFVSVAAAIVAIVFLLRRV